MVRNTDFDTGVPLPPGLTVQALRRAIEYVERELADLIDIYFEQANVFSALVGMYGSKALDSFIVYEKSKHTDIAQQRFPDLKRRGSPDPPPPEQSLESKASKRPWELQAHYDHPGWYIVWRYLVDPTMSFEPNCPLIVWRVDVAFLNKSDWKYERSTAGNQGGGRTHTFGLTKAAKRLANTHVYKRSDVRLIGGKPGPANGH